MHIWQHSQGGGTLRLGWSAVGVRVGAMGKGWGWGGEEGQCPQPCLNVVGGMAGKGWRPGQSSDTRSSRAGSLALCLGLLQEAVLCCLAGAPWWKLRWKQGSWD